MSHEEIRKALRDSAEVKLLMAETLSERIAEVAALLARTLSGGRKAIFCGNGGSAADSQHLATEFVVRLSEKNNRAAPGGNRADRQLLDPHRLRQRLRIRPYLLAPGRGFGRGG